MKRSPDQNSRDFKVQPQEEVNTRWQRISASLRTLRAFGCSYTKFVCTYCIKATLHRKATLLSPQVPERLRLIAE